jgi:hypothetical protein
VSLNDILRLRIAFDPDLRSVEVRTVPRLDRLGQAVSTPVRLALQGAGALRSLLADLRIDRYYHYKGDLFHLRAVPHDTSPEEFVESAQRHFHAIDAAWMRSFDAGVLTADDEALLNGRLDYIYVSSASFTPEQGAVALQAWAGKEGKPKPA